MIILHTQLINDVTVLLAVHDLGVDVRHALVPGNGVAAQQHIVLCGGLPAHPDVVSQRHGCNGPQDTADNTVTPPS